VELQNIKLAKRYFSDGLKV